VESKFKQQLSSVLPISVYQQNKQTPLTFVHKKDHDDNFFSFFFFTD